MKPFLAQKRLFTAALAAALGLISAGRAMAQTFGLLYSFTLASGFPVTNSDGDIPYGGVVLSSNTLYGTTYQGGTNGNGTVFAVNTDGTGFTNLHNFAASASPGGPNSDGAGPYAGLALSSNTLYGTTYWSGLNGEGTIFAIHTDGTGFINLHNFTAGADGAYPRDRLIVSGDTLYGTATLGGTGTATLGTVFRLKTDGTAFTNLHSFTGLSDGSSPYGGLVLSGDTLYGTGVTGGLIGTNGGSGTVFKLTTDGKTFTILHTFAPNPSPQETNSNGVNPEASLVLAGNTLYGTTQRGGSNGFGTVFAVNTDSTGFTNLHIFSFAPYDDVSGNNTNSDGAIPLCELFLSGSNLYGTTLEGGPPGYGTIFALNTNGAGFTNLYNFGVGALAEFASNPYAGPVLSSNTLYGTTTEGGPGFSGAVYAFGLGGSAPVPTPLNIQITGTNLVLSWNDASSLFSLQAAPTLTGVFTNIAGATSPYTVVPGANSQQFFRLVSN